MTLLVLADAATDPTSVHLTRLARRRGIAVRLVAPGALVLAPCWAHRVDARGARTSIGLADGTSIDDGAISGVFNRIWAIPEHALARFRAEDRGYSRAELHALAVSWLAGLRCPVMNPATPLALYGAPLSAARWQLLAHAAGFDTLALRCTTSQRRFPAVGMRHVERPDLPGGSPSPSLRLMGPAVLSEPAPPASASMLVVGRTVWPDGLPRAEAAPLVGPCRRLARAAGTPLLRVHLAHAGAWRFAGADAVPDVSDEAMLAAVLDTLTAAPSRPAWRGSPVEDEA